VHAAMVWFVVVLRWRFVGQRLYFFDSRVVFTFFDWTVVVKPTGCHMKGCGCTMM
jgi:hypothetical protein